MNNTWMTKYMNREEFLSWFNDEQEYVDAMFAQIVMFNFGVFIDATMMHMSDKNASGLPT